MLSALIAFWVLCAGGAVLVGADYGIVEALVGLLLGGVLGPFGLAAMLHYERTHPWQSSDGTEIEREDTTAAR